MNPLIQEKLRDGDSLSFLAAHYRLRITQHTKYPNLHHIKYDTGSPFYLPLVRECRGLILDADSEWNVVARPFDKFFNYGEPNAAQLDWATARVTEKLDGSLLYMYHYDGGWQVATTGTPDARGPVHQASMSFKDLFWQTFTDQGMIIPQQSNYTWMFELCTPENIQVVRHTSRRLSLLAVRSREGDELDIAQFPELNPVRTFPLRSLEEILQSFDQIDPTCQEGYVVSDRWFQRIKVKHPGYVALHHLKSTFSQRIVLELIRKGEASEVLAYFPEYDSVVKDIQHQFDSLSQKIMEAWEAHRDVATQKEFALRVRGLPYAAILFEMRKGKSLHDVMADLSLPSLQRLLEET